MKFKKIGENKIHCILTQEEMDAYGIQLDDFLDHKDKTEDFLRKVLAEARYELDLSDMGQYYSVQIAMMPGGDVSLIISGEPAKNSQDPLDEFTKHLQDFKEILEEAKHKLNEKNIEAKNAGDTSSKKEDQKEEKKAASKKNIKAVLDTPLWVCFKKLDDCILACKKMHLQGTYQSALYKYDDAYHLRLQFTDGEHQVAGIILVVSEYGDDIVTDAAGGAFIAEHGTCICKENAIDMLRAL